MLLRIKNVIQFYPCKDTKKQWVIVYVFTFLLEKCSKDNERAPISASPSDNNMPECPKCGE
jgi:hypothetical protein